MKKQVTRKPEENKQLLIQQVVINTVQRGSADIQTWRTAMQSAESITNPNRKALYDLYFETLLDGTLSSLVEKRILAITNTKIVFADANGKANEQIEGLINKPFFETMLKEVINSKIWGHTLLEFTWMPDEVQVKLIPRKHVEPNQGFIKKNPGDRTGLPYRVPQYQATTLEAGEPDNLGLLCKAVPYVLYKRGNWGDWAKFTELFGMPFRKGTYNGYDTAQRQQLEQALEQAGSAAFAIIPEGTDISIESGSGAGSSDVYKTLSDACDSQMSILILGQTMTTMDTANAGYAQGVIHHAVEQELHKDDRRFVERILNDKFIKLLEMNGYSAQNGKFSFKDDESVNLTERLTMDLQLANQVPIDPDYFYETYKIPKPNTAQNTAASEGHAVVSEDEPEDEPEDIPVDEPEEETLNTHYQQAIKLTQTEKWSKLLKRKLKRLFFLNSTNNDMPACVALGSVVNLTMIEDFMQILKNFHSGKDKPENLNPVFIENTFQNLLNAVKTGSGWNLETVDYSTPDYNFRRAMRENLFHFAGAKTYQQLKEINDMLLDENGKLVNYSTFRDKAEQYRQTAMQINEKYNNNWLRAEYNNAVNQSLSAKRWKEFEEDADIFPNLEYRTTGDGAVRPEHQRLNGIIKPINDTFWNKYNPPNDYGCRCRLRPTDRKADNTVPDIDIPKMFENNVAKNGYVFPEKHPYYTQNGIDKESIKKRTDEFGLQEHIKQQKGIYDDMVKGKYQGVGFNPQTGGFVMKEQDANPQPKELDIAQTLSNLGDGVVFKKVSAAKFTQTADAIVNGTVVEFKTPTVNKRSTYKNLLEHGLQQGRVVLLNCTDIDKSELKQALNDVKKTKGLKNIIVLHNQKKIVLSRTELIRGKLSLVDSL
jgi:SPP1 gp7 family putative phage head morphogenesis protein